MGFNTQQSSGGGGGGSGTVTNIISTDGTVIITNPTTVPNLSVQYKRASPDGTMWQLGVDNSGNIVWTVV